MRSSMFQSKAGRYLSQSCVPVMSWRRGNMALHKDSNMNRTRLMLMMLADRPYIRSFFIQQHKVSWRWTPSQQLEVSVFPGGEHQRFEDELCVIRELYVDCPRSHALTWTYLERFPLPGMPLSMYHRKIFGVGMRKVRQYKINLR
jgi:hypothetical protein